MAERPILLWLRQDLRLADHPALAAALEADAPIVPVYVLDDAAPGQWAMGGASRWWLHGSLAALAAALEARGSRLILRRGATADVLTALTAETGAEAVHWTRGYEPWTVRLETELHEALGDRGVDGRRYSGSLLFEPEAIQTGSATPFRVFTPFSKACRAAPDPGQPTVRPEALPAVPDAIDSEALDDWGLLPQKPDWAAGLRESWTPGEAGAARRLTSFLNRAMAGYADGRDRPARAGTSRLSPHLHFGEISPRQCWQAARQAAAGDPAKRRGGDSFTRELLWREFSAHLLFHWPELPEQPFRPDFAAFPWASNDKALTSWQRGRTGYPIVDAGMRQLWRTGWMHNRVRMIAASFLVKHLLIPWQEGEAWFWDTLVDADLANNAASWQWVAGCGADAAPYFRIFNPMLQGAKFDPDGAYVQRWVPELARLPAKHIHAPWEAPPDVLAQAGVTLGQNYPQPLVDHKTARGRALAAFETLKAGSG